MPGWVVGSAASVGTGRPPANKADMAATDKADRSLGASMTLTPSSAGLIGSSPVPAPRHRRTGRTVIEAEREGDGKEGERFPRRNLPRPSTPIARSLEVGRNSGWWIGP